MKIPVIDIFAGPGGLGEGFSSVPSKNRRVFDIKLSVEMDENAHKTLELRSFFRQFTEKNVPNEYYDVIHCGNIVDREQKKKELFIKYPKEAKIAQEEAWQATLGVVPEKEVDKRITAGLKGNRNWVLIGGPPCQAYSLVGRSRRQWKENLDKTDVRVHLYKEYLRIIAAHSPAVFVMENVKGLLSSTVDGVKMFDLIKKDLKDPSIVYDQAKHKYRVFSLTTEAGGFDDSGQPIYDKDTSFLIHSEKYDIPQKRHRVILLGIRDDIDVIPETLKKGQKKVTLKEVIGDLPKIRSGLNRSFISSEIIDGKKKRYYSKELDSSMRWEELINDFRSQIISWNGFAKDYKVNVVEAPKKGIGSEFIKCSTPSKKNPLYNWFNDDRLEGVGNHQSRSHLVQDLKRYMFSCMFAKTYKRFPRLEEYEKHSAELVPDHKNVKSGKFSDRFRVQMANEVATTVTSHISKDGHYFIHYDPDQCRSLSVREAARIQTFPDNYLFCGSRTAQYHQVGNAVPPYLAKQIAEVVLDVFKRIDAESL